MAQNILIVDHTSRASKSQLDRLAKLADFLTRKLNIGDNTTVEVSLVDADTISKLNLQFRGMNSPTDCLSFPQEEPEMLGDIIICIEVAQAKNYPATKLLLAPEEICLTHGLLHLLGYDHVAQSDAQVMEDLEDTLLQQWAQANPVK